MDQSEQLQYGFLYAQRLENLLHDQIRKSIDLEIRLSTTVEKFKDLENTSLVHTDIIKQATNSIEDLTVKNKTHETQNEEYRNRIVSLENNFNAINEENLAIKFSSEQKDIKIKELQRELEREKQESQSMFDELQNVKGQSEFKKIINKK
jgi:hypothetical protein